MIHLALVSAELVVASLAGSMVLGLYALGRVLGAKVSLRSSEPYGGEGGVGHSGAIETLALSRDGARLASVGGDLDLILWPVRSPLSGRKVSREPYADLSHAFAPDFSYYVRRDDFKRVQVCNTADGTPRSTFEANGNVDRLVLDPTGTRVALVTDDAIEVREVHTGAEILTLPTPGSLVQVLFVLGGEALAYCDTTGGGSRLRVVEVPSGEPLRSDIVSPAWIDGLACDALGRQLVLRVREDVSLALNLATGQLKRWTPIVYPSALALSPDGTLAATVVMGRLSVRDAETGRELLLLSGHHTTPVRALTFAPNGDLFSGDEQGLIVHWRLS